MRIWGGGGRLGRTVVGMTVRRSWTKGQRFLDRVRSVKESKEKGVEKKELGGDMREIEGIKWRVEKSGTKRIEDMSQ